MGDINQNAMDSLISGIDYLIDSKIKEAPNDRTYVGIIQDINLDKNTYTVLINGNKYQNVPSLFKGFSINETVKLVSPQNQMSQLYILGKINMTQNSNVNGSSVTSVNGKSGDVVLTTNDINALNQYSKISFNEASKRENINTNETFSVLFGKIKKWFNDLGSLAFKSKVEKNDLSDEVKAILNDVQTIKTELENIKELLNSEG